MKRLLLTTSIAVLLLSSASAMARDNDKGKDKHDKHDRDRSGYSDRRDHDDDRGYDDRRHDDRRYDDRRHDNGRHLGQIKHGYRRGMHAPVVYLQPRYYVNDYRQYRLSAPPRGYRWVRPQNDHYLLVEAATGLISQALGY
ncbi:MAG: RcnB family protein [Pseudoxanthomonas sp.]